MVEITQEELDRLRALEIEKPKAPLSDPDEGLATQTIADYLRGDPQTIQPKTPLSYQNTLIGGETPDFHTLALERKKARDLGASLSELKAADAANRQTNEQNPFGYNKRQTAALQNAWASSPDRVALEAENAQRAKQGLPAIQSDFGLNRYHTNKDGSRDYNYSADGQYRGAIPEEFRNAPGNANTHDAHFNKETGKWEAGDLSLMQTFKDLGQGAMDAYGNIRNTIPLMGAEVVDGVKGLAGKFGGGNAISGGGADGVGNWGALGDFLGGIGDSTGLTSYGDLAAKKAASAPLRGNAVVDPARAASLAAANKTYADTRDRESSGTKAQKAANRAQLQKKATAHTNSAVKSFKSGTAPKPGATGFNMGGPIGYNVGGPIAQSRVREEQIQQQQMARAPQVASSGGGGIGQQIGKKILGSVLSSATGGLGGMLGGLFNDGGRIPQTHRGPGGQMMTGAVHRNTGGPLSNPNGYAEGGSNGATPIKKVMDEQKLMQNQKAFDMDQARKQEAHAMAMKQKQQAFSEGQKMKKESATTTMKPKAPLGG